MYKKTLKYRVCTLNSRETRNAVCTRRNTFAFVEAAFRNHGTKFRHRIRLEFKSKYMLDLFPSRKLVREMEEEGEEEGIVAAFLCRPASNLRRTRNLLRRKQYRLRVSRLYLSSSLSLSLSLFLSRACESGYDIEGGRIENRHEQKDGRRREEDLANREKELSCFHCAQTKRIPGDL